MYENKKHKPIRETANRQTATLKEPQHFLAPSDWLDFLDYEAGLQLDTVLFFTKHLSMAKVSQTCTFWFML